MPTSRHASVSTRLAAAAAASSSVVAFIGVLLNAAPALAHPCDHPGTKGYKILGCAKKHAVHAEGSASIVIAVPGVAIAVAGAGTEAELSPPPPPPPAVVYEAPPSYEAPPAPPAPPEPPAAPEPPPARTIVVHDACCMAPHEPAWGDEAPPAPPARVAVAPPEEAVATSWWRAEPRIGVGVRADYGDGPGDATAVSGLGVDLRFRPHRFFQLELSTDYLGALKEGAKRADLLPMASILVRPFPRWFVGVYGLAGVGMSFVTRDGADSWSGAPAWQLGAGAELRLWRRFALTADLRYVRTYNGGAVTVAEPACATRPEDPRCLGVDATSESGTNRLLLTIGASVYF
jgi:hypothetical protein